MGAVSAGTHRFGPGYFISRGILLFLVVLTFLPFLALINMSFKSYIMIQVDFFGLPHPVEWNNYLTAFHNIFRPILNSLFVCIVSLAGTLALVVLSGYAFGRLDFAGKEILYMVIISVLMIPGSLLFIPQYYIVYKLGFLNTYMALIFPYIAGCQIFGIILARSFFANMSEEMFEAARIEGAGEFYTFSRIAVPLSVPILITVGITVVIGIYNDYIWPTIVLTGSDAKATFCQVAFNKSTGNGRIEYGVLTAELVLGSIPLLIIASSCLKYYMRGMMEGAIKG